MQGRGAKQVGSRRPAYGATFIEMLVIMALVLSSLFGALVGHIITESWLGSLTGGILGAVVWIGFLSVVFLFMDLWSGYGLPKCRNGCCRGPGLFKGDGDYDLQKIEGEYFYICECGDRYQRRGKRFLLVGEDGAESRCLIWRPFRGWSPDKGSHSN